MFTSKTSLSSRPQMVRPMSRKDIFYSGSVTNLREFQSQKSLTNYRNSVISLTKYEKQHSGDVRYQPADVEKGPTQRKFVLENVFLFTLLLIFRECVDKTIG